jgi:phage protein D
MPPVLYIPELLLEINGQPASSNLMEDILQITVEESLHLPGMFTLMLNNSYFSGRSQDQAWEHQNVFSIGKAIKIGFISSTTRAPEFTEVEKEFVLQGEITAIETHFTNRSQAPILIRGYDVAHRLHRGRYNRSFQNMKDSDIVRKILGEIGIQGGTIETSNPTHDYVFQENQTNMEFLRERAARIGFELFVQDGKLNFRKPKVGDSLDLKWLREIHSFQVRVTSTEQVSEVEVRGWDYTQKVPIVSNKNTDQVLTKTEYGKGKTTSQAFDGKPANPKMIVVDQPIFSTTEADLMAQALVDELGGEFVQADAIAEGDPKIRPGRVVKLSDLGKYSGKYYITDTRHCYVQGVYSTEFSVRGLRGGNLLETSPQTRLQPGQTLMVGIVSNNKDPQGWGRVRVKFPTLTEVDESNWARVVGIGAGANRGFDCLPEINDEVLVAFEHGDIHRPYVIGGVWNGKDAPPEKVADTIVDGKVRLRTVKTRIGHKLQFVEEDKGKSKVGIYVETKGGHHLHINDSEKFIEVKTNGGHILRLDDSDKTINMTSTGDIALKAGTTGTSRKISLNAGEIALTGTQKITLTVGGSTIEVTPTGIKIQAAVSVDIQAVTTNVKGSAIVQVQGGLIKLN